MAIVVTPTGGSFNKASSDPYNCRALGPLVLSTGDSLIVALAYDYGGVVNNVQWDNIFLTRDRQSVNADGVVCEIWSLHNVTGANSNILVDWSTAPTAMASETYQVSGLATTSTLDKVNSATGTDAPYNTGSGGVLSQANELAIAAIGIESVLADFGAWTTGAG